MLVLEHNIYTKESKKMFEPLYPPQHRNKCYCHTKRESSIQHFQKLLPKNGNNFFVKTNELATVINNKKSTKLNTKCNNFVKIKSVSECANTRNESNHETYTNRRLNYKTDNCTTKPISIIDSKNVFAAATSLSKDNIDQSRRLYDVATFRFNNSDECISNNNNNSSSLNFHFRQNHVCKYRLMLNNRNQLVSSKDNMFMCYICGKSVKKTDLNSGLLSTENCVVLNKTNSNTWPTLLEFDEKFKEQHLLVLEIMKCNETKSEVKPLYRKNLKNMYHSCFSLKNCMK